MNYSFLPDLLALAILIVILLLLRRRHPQGRADIWLLGLFFTLVEAVAHTFYPLNGPPPWTLHLIVMDCYLLGGVVFVWASAGYPGSSTTELLYLWVNSLPLLALTTLYGMHLYSPVVFFVCIAAGFVAGVSSSLYLKHNWRYALLHACGWLLVAYLVRRGGYREAVYWSLCGLYGIAALNFERRLARNSTGKLAIVTGFTIWAVCLLLHPWIVRYREFADIASHVWNMQKSLISIGMILVMLEEQVSSNEWLALHDELTGLPNRRLFADRLSAAIERADRMRGRLALVILDLNGFKSINDTLGHQAGDQVLREVANHLRRSVREADTVARLGGDEFILVASDLGVDQTMDQFMEAVRTALEEPVLVEGQTMVVSASLGMAVYPDDAEDSITLLRVADQRMYALKHRPEFLPKAGRNMKAGVGDSGKIAVAGRQ
ncbi:MAG: GGDEF domain-containing protein [Edaphobacter sp.]